jgi:hypothetical protein
MQAIRQSPEPMRTMDAFWSGQIKSKEWLIDSLEHVIRPNINTESLTIEIHGGWVGTLASMLFQSNLNIKSIRSIDIDPSVRTIAEEMNRLEVIQNKFEAVTADMCSLKNYQADVVINTSCEHITQEQYNRWLDNTPKDAIIITQGNNYKIDEHIRLSNDIDDFETQCHLNRKFAGTLRLPLYHRYMIIGKK